MKSFLSSCGTRLLLLRSLCYQRVTWLLYWSMSCDWVRFPLVLVCPLHSLRENLRNYVMDQMQILSATVGSLLKSAGLSALSAPYGLTAPI